jgi:hypothetical protein
LQKLGSDEVPLILKILAACRLPSISLSRMYGRMATGKITKVKIGGKTPIP